MAPEYKLVCCPPLLSSEIKDEIIVIIKKQCKTPILIIICRIHNELNPIY